jgi:hypothetical protein
MDVRTNMARDTLYVYSQASPPYREGRHLHLHPSGPCGSKPPSLHVECEQRQKCDVVSDPKSSFLNLKGESLSLSLSLFLVSLSSSSLSLPRLALSLSLSRCSRPLQNYNRYVQLQQMKTDLYIVPTKLLKELRRMENFLEPFVSEEKKKKKDTRDNL